MIRGIVNNSAAILCQSPGRAPSLKSGPSLSPKRLLDMQQLRAVVGAVRMGVAERAVWRERC